jgi:hypothetical protein
MVTLIEAASNIQEFERGSLTNRISTIENTQVTQVKGSGLTISLIMLMISENSIM